MKKIIVSLTILFSVSAWAKTTLKIPVYIEPNIPVSKINKKLEDKGLKTLPEYFELSTDDKDPYKKYDKMSKQVAEATKQLGKEEYLQSETIPNSDMKGTCYTGRGGEPVVDLVFSLAGSFYTEQMNLWGWKYKKASKVNPDILANESKKGETERFLNKGSALWREWRGQGEAVLMVVAYSDDGDDMNDVIVPRCK